VKDQDNKLRKKGGDPLQVEVVGPNGTVLNYINDEENGTYGVSYLPDSPGWHSIQRKHDDLLTEKKFQSLLGDVRFNAAHSTLKLFRSRTLPLWRRCP
jgi:hypothetical protein